MLYELKRGLHSFGTSSIFRKSKDIVLKGIQGVSNLIIIQATYLKAIPKSFEAVGSILAS